MTMIIKNGTSSGLQGSNHLQGVAVDVKNDRIYYSYTTSLVATTLRGKKVGSVDGLIGHLGCICFNEEDGLVYGSLEYKHDAVGQGISASIGNSREYQDGFYIAVFDGLKITESNMDGEKDGIMKAAFLGEVLEDYNAEGENGKKHRYGCSGIDGTTFAHLPGDKDSGKYLYVAYGIYCDCDRSDNDNQVILCYSPEEIKSSAKPLNQFSMHTSGPEKPLHKYFAFTGNTNWGVQNLSFDKETDLMFMAVYKGGKEEFENYDMFAVDMSVKAENGVIEGLGEEGERLTLCGSSTPVDRNRRGWYVGRGQFGMPKVGDSFIIAETFTRFGQQSGKLYNYRFTEQEGFIRLK